MITPQHAHNTFPATHADPPATGSSLSHQFNPAIDLAGDRRPSLARLVRVELRKMTDTLSGRTLVGLSVAAGFGIQIFMLIAKVINDANDFPFAGFIAGGIAGAKLVLPAVVILAVTGEWTQRASLSTFTLVPDRGRVLASKLGAAVVVAGVAFVVTVGCAALVNLVSGFTTGSPAVWDTDLKWVAEQSLPLFYLTMMAFGFAVLTLNSSAALVGYYLASFALPQLINSIGMFGRIGEFAAWINPANYGQLIDNPSGSAWAHFAVSATIWVIVPIAVGIRRVVTTEIK